MSFLASILRFPRWLEKAWQATVIDLEKARAQQPDPREAETMPLPMQNWLDRRR